MRVLVISVKSINININVEMVRLGHAKYYTRFGPGRYEKEFEVGE